MPNKVLATENRTTLPKERVLVEAIETTKRELETRSQAKRTAAKKKTACKRKPRT